MPVVEHISSTFILDNNNEDEKMEQGFKNRKKAKKVEWEEKDIKEWKKYIVITIILIIWRLFVTSAEILDVCVAKNFCKEIEISINSEDCGAYVKTCA